MLSKIFSALTFRHCNANTKLTDMQGLVYIFIIILQSHQDILLAGLTGPVLGQSFLSGYLMVLLKYTAVPFPSV